MNDQNWISAGTLEALQKEKAKVIKGGIAVFYHEDSVYAIDNRCPHLGFPLHTGSLCEGILTCHWHHARFDLCGGGTLDPWADDVIPYEVRIKDEEVWVNTSPRLERTLDTYRERLIQGLQQNIGIVMAKAVVGLMELQVPAAEIGSIGIEYGTKYGDGWNAGLTILTAMIRILPHLDRDGQILALYQGLVHVARHSSNRPERHLLSPLPSTAVSRERRISWYRNSMEVRDIQGAERILLTTLDAGDTDEQIAEMMFTAVTDHFYIDGGHTLDFHNKAFESLQYVQPKQRKRVLSSLVPLLRNPTRSEELHHWQAPIDLVKPIHEASQSLAGERASVLNEIEADEEQALFDQLLSDRPLETFKLLSKRLAEGASPVQIAQLLTLAAAERVCRFHTQNDFGDWDTVLHTFTYCHAVHEMIGRNASPLLNRAILHGAASLYLDRFLNVPKAPAVEPSTDVDPGQPGQLLDILDKRQQVSEAEAWVRGFLKMGGKVEELINVLGHALLREDADFHTFQMLEAAIAEYEQWSARSDPFAEQAKETLLIAAARYLAAHAPTARTIPHTARIAWRLHKGEHLYQ